MNKKSQLQYMQKKLTVIFTLLVFGIATFLQGAFFSYKYFSGRAKEVSRIEFLSSEILKRDLALAELHKVIKNEKKLGDSQKKANKIFGPKKPGKIMNFAILDSSNNVIIQNIRGDVNLEAVVEVIQKKQTDVIIKNNTIIKYIEIPRSIETYQFVIFKELNYSSDDYFSDILIFFFVILASSILFYIIGFGFVRKNLQPVAKNIEEMNDFVHNAGHELKTPLAVVNSNLQLMKQIGEYNEAMMQENLGEINRLNHLIEALVSLTNIHDLGETHNNSLQQEIQHILDELSMNIKEKQLSIVFDEQKDFMVESDREYLYILLSNIIKNSVKFSQQKGRIEISYKENICKIKDYGIGISQENLKNIFGRFYQEKGVRNNDGFGIGLALVAKISKLYGWKIDVKSEKGKYSEFIIKFK